MHHVNYLTKNKFSFQLGPCPPCPKIVNISCNCMKSNATPRRCSNKFWSCNNTCGKLLTCKQHYCTKLCHEGDCIECLKTSIQFCYCKKNKKEVSCAQTFWECDQVGILLVFKFNV